MMAPLLKRGMRVSAYLNLCQTSDPSGNRATGGCGLDLAIAHSIALAMGGSVVCDVRKESGRRKISVAGRSGTAMPDMTAA